MPRFRCTFGRAIPLLYLLRAPALCPGRLWDHREMTDAPRRYRELDEVIAPEDVPEAGVRAGDKGVVLIEFERPHPAVEVEFISPDGKPGPCVIYSPNLSEVYSHHEGYWL